LDEGVCLVVWGRGTTLPPRRNLGRAAVATRDDPDLGGFAVTIVWILIVIILVLLVIALARRVL
jgi:hypothetical protein